jgi:hypothetical protein
MELDHTYQEAMERIEGQQQGFLALAKPSSIVDHLRLMASDHLGAPTRPSRGDR